MRSKCVVDSTCEVSNYFWRGERREEYGPSERHAQQILRGPTTLNVMALLSCCECSLWDVDFEFVKFLPFLPSKVHKSGAPLLRRSSTAWRRSTSWLGLCRSCSPCSASVPPAVMCKGQEDGPLERQLSTSPKTRLLSHHSSSLRASPSCFVRNFVPRCVSGSR